MKKSILFSVICAAFVLAAALVSTKVVSNFGDDVLNENVEALTINESQEQEGLPLNDPIWIRFYRSDGGFNCCRGGNEIC